MKITKLSLLSLLISVLSIILIIGLFVYIIQLNKNTTNELQQLKESINLKEIDDETEEPLTDHREVQNGEDFNVINDNTQNDSLENNNSDQGQDTPVVTDNSRPERKFEVINSIGYNLPDNWNANTAHQALSLSPIGEPGEKRFTGAIIVTAYTYSPNIGRRAWYCKLSNCNGNSTFTPAQVGNLSGYLTQDGQGYFVASGNTFYNISVLPPHKSEIFDNSKQYEIFHSSKEQVLQSLVFP